MTGKIAYLASRVTLPGSPNRRIDAFEHDHMMAALGPAFTARGMELHDVSWDDEEADWTGFDAVVIGTTWDYWDRPEAFLGRMNEIGEKTRLFNPAGLVHWNSRKSYLRELGEKGIGLIETVWLDTYDRGSAAHAVGQLRADTLVFKRQIGAGAKGQYRIRRGEELPDMSGPVMIQPYLATIEEEGELSFIFIDNSFSHAVRKRPRPGDYRVQSSFGGREQPIEPDARDLAAARLVLEALPHPPLYARIDMLRGPGGGMLLMEAELIEPYLYPLEGPQLGALLAESLARRL